MRALEHLDHRVVAHSARHEQSGRVPRGARGELIALEHHDVAPSLGGQVVGRAQADDPSPDDHDSGATGLDRGLKIGWGAHGGGDGSDRRMVATA